MARGKKANPNRDEVRNRPIQIRVNQYEYLEILKCLNLLNDSRPVSTFVRDLINDNTKEIIKNDHYTHNV